MLWSDTCGIYSQTQRSLSSFSNGIVQTQQVVVTAGEILKFKELRQTIAQPPYGLRLSTLVSSKPLIPDTT